MIICGKDCKTERRLILVLADIATLRESPVKLNKVRVGLLYSGR